MMPFTKILHRLLSRAAGVACAALALLSIPGVAVEEGRLAIDSVGTTAKILEISRQQPEFVIQIDKGKDDQLRLNLACVVLRPVPTGKPLSIAKGRITKLGDKTSEITFDGRPSNLFNQETLSKYDVRFPTPPPALQPNPPVARPVAPPVTASPPSVPSPPPEWKLNFEAMMKRGDFLKAEELLDKMRDRSGASQEWLDSKDSLLKAVVGEFQQALKTKGLANYLERYREHNKQFIIANEQARFESLNQEWTQIQLAINVGRFDDALAGCERVAKLVGFAPGDVRNVSDGLREKLAAQQKQKKEDQSRQQAEQVRNRLNSHLQQTEWVDLEKDVAEARGSLAVDDAIFVKSQTMLQTYIAARNRLSKRAYASAAEMRSLEADLDNLGGDLTVETLTAAAKKLAECGDTARKDKVDARLAGLVFVRFKNLIEAGRKSLHDGRYNEATQFADRAAHESEAAADDAMRSQVRAFQGEIDQARGSAQCTARIERMAECLARKDFTSLASVVAEYEKAACHGVQSELDKYTQYRNTCQAHEKSMEELAEADRLLGSAEYENAFSAYNSAKERLRKIDASLFSNEFVRIDQKKEECRRGALPARQKSFMQQIGTIKADIDKCSNVSCCDKCSGRVVDLGNVFADLIQGHPEQENQLKDIRNQLAAKRERLTRPSKVRPSMP